MAGDGGVALNCSAVGFSSALVCPLICGMFFCSGHWLEELESAFPQLLVSGPVCYHQKGVAAQLLRNAKVLTYKMPFKSLQNILWDFTTVAFLLSFLDSKKPSDLKMKNALTNLFLYQFCQNYLVASMLILSCCANWSENLVKDFNWVQGQSQEFFRLWSFIVLLRILQNLSCNLKGRCVCV